MYDIGSNLNKVECKLFSVCSNTIQTYVVI